MPLDPGELSKTIQAMRPTVPARDFAVGLRFYAELGFRSRAPTHDPVEMTLGSCAFLQNYCVREWADDSIIHIFVSGLNG